MKAHIVVSALASILTGALAYEPKLPLVQTKYGSIRGSIQLSSNSRPFHSFRGIPYAKPPIGDLRFKAPEPPEEWPFPRDATQEGPFCMQKNYLFANATVEGQEDCLYLNVYVPQTPTARLPVMVFLHWGAFFAGRGTSDYLGPEYFMDKDVILVTFNYRLGVLGFLSTLDDQAPGNYALKDQVLALKFVQENIARFGGDRNKVTLFGQSAGAGSVSLHMISPASKGLFQRAISQSGVGLDGWARTLNALQVPVLAAQASFVGCASNLSNNTKLVACLRNVSAESLVASGDNFKYFSIEPITTYTLVSEKQTEANPSPFLTKDPLEYLQAGEFQRVPWIVGNVQDEGILRVAPLLRQKDTLKELNANFRSLLPNILIFQISTLDIEDLYNKVTDFYLDGKTYVDVNDSRSVQGFIDLYSDRSFVYGTYQTVILQSLKGHTPIWMYNFDYKGQYSYGDLFAATNDDIDFSWGVSHCDDLLYLFKSPALFPELKNEHDLSVSATLLKIWTDFATHGNPDPDNSLNWSRLMFNNTEDIRNANLRYLNISGTCGSRVTLEMQKGFLTERMHFWANQSLNENFLGLK